VTKSQNQKRSPGYDLDSSFLLECKANGAASPVAGLARPTPTTGTLTGKVRLINQVVGNQVQTVVSRIFGTEMEFPIDPHYSRQLNKFMIKTHFLNIGVNCSHTRLHLLHEYSKSDRETDSVRTPHSGECKMGPKSYSL